MDEKGLALYFNGIKSGMSFGLDQPERFTLYQRPRRPVREPFWGGVAQLVRAAES